MMIKQQSLSRALSFAGCRDLPKALNPDLDMFWIRAITLVKKKNGNEEFVISEQRATGLVNHIADFGTMSPIGSVIRFYPYMYLDDGVRRSCENTMRDFLAVRYPDKGAEIYSAGDEELAIMRLQYAIDLQKDGMNGYLDNSPKDAVQAAEDDIAEDTEEAPEEVMTVYEEGTMVIDDVVELAPSKKKSKRRK